MKLRAHEKANREVRLFSWAGLAATIFLSSAPAEDSIPEAWIEAANRDRSLQHGQSVVPDYERELVHRIRKRILEVSGENGNFASYEGQVPTGEFTYSMVSVPGGSFPMGSPASEKDRESDEGPQREVTVSPFWIGETEVTWSQFLPFASRLDGRYRNRNGSPKSPDESKRLVDWVSGPTQYYIAPDSGMGLEGDYPAVGFTQHAASKFCQWLSAQTGHYYRLPTEAEWEYACRAGTTGPFSVPENRLGEFAVVDPQQVRSRYEKVRSGKANPWGLFDMHGNVAEWCLDGYEADAYSKLSDGDPYLRATQRYPRVIRGGSWWDEPSDARSANRTYSHPDLNQQDPELPQSLWWLTDSTWVGFRIVRPREIPTEEEMYELWNTGAMHHEETDSIPDPE